MDGLILTAAGSSTRFGRGRSKVLEDLRGRTVLERALAPFREVLPGLAVVVTARPEDVARIRALLPDVLVVPGGASRQESVALGLEALPAEVELALVHDAARPLVTAAVVERVVAAAREHGAAAAVVPMRDTLHRLGRTDQIGPVLSPGVGREGLARAQTPQAARAPLLRAAVAAAHAAGFAATDEVSLLMFHGAPVVPVAGTLTNFKITEPADLDLARHIFREVR